MHPSTDRAAVPLGERFISPAALKALFKAGVSPASLLRRHANGDWGDVDEGQDARNAFAVYMTNDEIVSLYPLPTGDRIKVVTVGDRSRTFIVLVPYADPGQN